MTSNNEKTTLSVPQQAADIVRIPCPTAILSRFRKPAEVDGVAFQANGQVARTVVEPSSVFLQAFRS